MGTIDPIPTFPDERRTAALPVQQCGTLRPKVDHQLGKPRAYPRSNEASELATTVHLTGGKSPYLEAYDDSSRYIHSLGSCASTSSHLRFLEVELLYSE